jgi:hypothetical protein
LLKTEDYRGLISLFYGHVEPYGTLKLVIFAQRTEKVKQEFSSQYFSGYFRLLPDDFLFMKANWKGSTHRVQL